MTDSQTIREIDWDCAMGREILPLETFLATCTYPTDHSEPAPEPAPHPLEKVLSELQRLLRLYRNASSGDLVTIRAREIARAFAPHGEAIFDAARKGLAIP